MSPALQCNATVTVFCYYFQRVPEHHNYIVSIVLEAIHTKKGSNLRATLHSLSAAKVFNVVGAKKSARMLSRKLFFYFYYDTTKGWLLCMYIIMGILCLIDIKNI